MTNNRTNSAFMVSQIKSTSISSVETSSSSIPFDDSIPQNTEGTEILTLSITPKSTSSTLLIEFTTFVTKDASNGNIVVALFQDSNANAIEALGAQIIGASRAQPIFLRHVMTSGTTSPTTFKIRIGTTSTNAYINGNNTGNRLMGGIANTTLTITEMI